MVRSSPPDRDRGRRGRVAERRHAQPVVALGRREAEAAIVAGGRPEVGALDDDGRAGHARAGAALGHAPGHDAGRLGVRGGGERGEDGREHGEDRETHRLDHQGAESESGTGANGSGAVRSRVCAQASAGGRPSPMPARVPRRVLRRGVTRGPARGRRRRTAPRWARRARTARPAITCPRVCAPTRTRAHISRGTSASSGPTVAIVSAASTPAGRLRQTVRAVNTSTLTKPARLVMCSEIFHRRLMSRMTAVLSGNRAAKATMSGSDGPSTVRHSSARPDGVRRDPDEQRPEPALLVAHLEALDAPRADHADDVEQRHEAEERHRDPERPQQLHRPRPEVGVDERERDRREDERVEEVRDRVREPVGARLLVALGAPQPGRAGRVGHRLVSRRARRRRGSRRAGPRRGRCPAPRSRRSGRGTGCSGSSPWSPP